MTPPFPRRGYADGPFGQIHYQQQGDGQPLVLLHQAPMTSGQYDQAYAPLAARGFRAIGIDMPGFGQSDAASEAPTVDDYARVVTPVLDALGLRTAVVAGHHTGGLAAVAAAVGAPDRVSHLVIHGPLHITQAEADEYLATGHQWELGFVAQPEGAHFAELARIREGFAAGTIPPARISDYVVQAFSGRGAFWHGHHAAYTYRLDEEILRVTQPTLILTNTGDIIHDLAARTLTARPDFALAVLEGGGVDILDQQPEAWAEAVAAFVFGSPA